MNSCSPLVSSSPKTAWVVGGGGGEGRGSLGINPQDLKARQFLCYFNPQGLNENNL